MSDTRIKSIVIVGGGTAGWMAAAAIAKKTQQTIKITLIESGDIPTVGVGEATVPYIKEFLRSLDINEKEFMVQTQATYKLGIDFDGWKTKGDRFFHPFAGYGSRIAGIPFYHYWIKLKNRNKALPLDAYCFAAQMAKHHKFALPKPNSDIEISSFNYAFHFDASLFAHYLSQLAQQLGVQRIHSTITQVHQSPIDGCVSAVQLDTGEKIAADFFIDCSGFRGLLIEETLKTGYDDWTRWLPCNKAIALPCSRTQEPAPFTRSLACTAGWQWRIPLQHRVGNGYVYCKEFISDDNAVKELEQQLEGPALADPKFMAFTAGMRKKTWNKNVYSLGLASGFLEPLESTSIYMIQESINLLLDNFPQNQINSYLIESTNKTLQIRQEKLRDFLVLHYVLNQRRGEPFWDYCRNMAIPDSLKERMELFKHTAQMDLNHLDFFRTNSWLAMYAGFDFLPPFYHPFVDQFDEALIAQELTTIAQSIEQTMAGLPSHSDFIRKNISG